MELAKVPGVRLRGVLQALRRIRLFILRNEEALRGVKQGRMAVGPVGHHQTCILKCSFQLLEGAGARVWGPSEEEIAFIPGKRCKYKYGLGPGRGEQAEQINFPNQSLPNQMDGRCPLERWNTGRGPDWGEKILKSVWDIMGLGGL